MPEDESRTAFFRPLFWQITPEPKQLLRQARLLQKTVQRTRRHLEWRFDADAGFGEIVMAQELEVTCPRKGVNPVFSFAYIATAGTPDSR